MATSNLDGADDQEKNGRTGWFFNRRAVSPNHPINLKDSNPITQSKDHFEANIFENRIDDISHLSRELMHHEYPL